MNLVGLLQIASLEERAEEFLREKGVPKTFDSCPFCNAKNIGKVRTNFYKCYKCKKEWSIRKDSILADLKVPLSKFILAVKLFILEVSVNKAHKELDLAYNTTHKIYAKLRQCIYEFVSKDDQLLSEEVKMDESYFGAKRKGSRCLSIRGSGCLLP